MSPARLTPLDQDLKGSSVKGTLVTASARQVAPYGFPTSTVILVNRSNFSTFTTL